MAQQMAGLDFAAEHCHPFNKGTSLESSACAALQNLRAQRQQKSISESFSGNSGSQ
jgi:hypothetical protein